MDTYAPIVLFVYNRLEHTRRTVESLLGNELAKKSELFVFSDGAKYGQEEAVKKVRHFINSISGFKKVTIVEKKKNSGLAKSIIAGVSIVLSQFGKVIVIEDDLLFSDDFLSYMNQCLDFYRAEPNVMSVGGYSFPVVNQNPSYLYDVYYSYRTVSWGWGTWIDAWEKVDWDVREFDITKKSKKKIKQFERGGADLFLMLDHQMSGLIDSWSIRFDYAHYINDAVAVLPLNTRVLNIGQDGSGTHCNTEYDSRNTFSKIETNKVKFINELKIERNFIEQIYDMHGSKFLNVIKYFLIKYLKG
jgi:hypothetical protein